jgi:hypothetical protein
VTGEVAGSEPPKEQKQQEEEQEDENLSSVEEQVQETSNSQEPGNIGDHKQLDEETVRAAVTVLQQRLYSSVLGYGEKDRKHYAGESWQDWQAGLTNFPCNKNEKQEGTKSIWFHMAKTFKLAPNLSF